MNQAKTGPSGRIRVLAVGVVLLLVALTGSVVLQAGPSPLLPRLGVGWRPPAEEEEEDTKPKKNKKIRLNDDSDDKDATPQAAATDLARAASEATNRRVKALYSALRYPADRVTLRKIEGVTISGNPLPKGTLLVQPLPFFVSSPKKLKAALPLNIIDESGKKLKSERVSPGLIASIRYYEQAALAAVQEFLDERNDERDSANAGYVAKFEQLTAAEVVLGAVLRFHQSARERGVRKGEGWEPIETALSDKLFDVLLAQLDEMIAAKSWDSAFALTRRLTETYRRPKDHKRIAAPLATLLKKALLDTNYGEDRLRDARQRLRQFEDEFPESKILVPIRDSLRDQAKSLFEQAKLLVKEKKTSQALANLRKAEGIWPELPGLRTYRMQIDSSYQVLRVGMRELPTNLSPARASTDAELRAVDLLFESLVNLAPDGEGVLYYRPGLTEGRIRVVPLGREFKLPRSAQWSDGKKLTVGDLSFTVDLLKDGRGTGRGGAWGDLLTRVRVGGDPYRVKLIMRQGFIDPLALMSFKVLPARTRPHPDSAEFARKPISSGPFEYAGTGDAGGRSAVIFRANPHYGARGGKLGLPRISEVHFIRVSDPVKDLENRVIDLALDLTAEQAAELRKSDSCEVPLPGEKSVNRRIYFLAVNHRKPALSSADFRIALAQAINREGLLDDHFRKGLGRDIHRALNGPYPARSWACNPALFNRVDKNSLDPYDPAEAKTGARQVLTRLGRKQLNLKVKYPAGDKQAETAVKDLCDRVNKVLEGVTLEPEQRAPSDLREDLEQTHSFDLAYTWYDYPDETFWLMPLLGPTGKAGGENFLGYNGSLINRIQTATNQRSFTQVRHSTQAIHRLFLKGDMPFIPLWQLDPLYASKKGVVEMVSFDPYRIFARIELWRVRHGG